MVMNSKPGRVFTLVADAPYFPGLWAVLNSLWVYHRGEVPVAVFDGGLEPGQRERVAGHPAGVEVMEMARLPFAPTGTWEAKQQMPGALLERWRTVYLLDADLVLTSNLDDVFEEAEKGWILASGDGSGITFGPEFAGYHESLPGRHCDYLNSGCLCLDVRRHWDLMGLWSFSSRYGSYSPGKGEPLGLPGHGDQGMFNAIARRLGKDEFLRKLPEEEWCDSTTGSPVEITERHGDGRLTVMNGRTGRRQRVVHSTGPKWWRERGREQQGGLGQKLEVFLHFWNDGDILAETGGPAAGGAQNPEGEVAG